MTKKEIYELIKAYGYTDVAAAALLGNMEAESNCVSCRLQGDFTDGYTRSRDYTAQVNYGVVSRHDFIYNGPNGGGYGLLQWTYFTRKAGLYALAMSTSRSIDDPELQIEWMDKELRSSEYRDVYNTLSGSESIRECSDIIVKKFLRPADQSESVLSLRAKYAREFYDEFAEEEEASPSASGSPDIKAYDDLSLGDRAILIVAYLKEVLEMIEEFSGDEYD